MNKLTTIASEDIRTRDILVDNEVFGFADTDIFDPLDIQPHQLVKAGQAATQNIMFQTVHEATKNVVPKMTASLLANTDVGRQIFQKFL